MDFPSGRIPPLPIMTTVSRECAGGLLTNGSLNTVASGTWIANNLAWFYPFSIKDWAVAYQLLFWVGATSSGNIDVGIYDSQKNRVVSAGSTAMSATVNTVQEIDIADTVLAPGDYLLAASCSTTAGTVFRVSSNDDVALPENSVYEQALGSVALPDPCTPIVSTQSSIHVIVIGIQFRSVF